ncbi:protease inhibitor [Salpingoeca rosetta]|uniref:Protease inhibitor n=1 Tax=Salpingoeca rosetta (strain ATCC 50818 / BSB-021) TaxID=946362 RepID=F2UDI5_SALR5|nr:protease inhibitor [Salpingoeca rosetta]EGD74680.1 protease inhibitor [Salpingoeca rosetta]|eukprot:XP_004992937.1 protease inhibitor [Salpingoeca rosetta]
MRLTTQSMYTLREGLKLNELVRVTVQVRHKDNANKQDNQCFSHEGQSSYHWSEYDSGVFLVNCPAPVCAHDTVPRVYRVNPGCGLDADASTVEVGVWIDPTYGDDARATCAFWRPTSDGSSWQCTWHGCYAPATVDVDRNVITCEVPNGMPASGPVRITVQVWHANNEDKQDNQCFSHEGQSPSQWEAYDYAVLEIRCPAPECRPQYVPRVFEVEPACGLAEDAETVDVSVAIDPSYGVHARATCGFWVEDPTTGALSCTWHGCYAEAAVSSNGDTITCAVPDGLPRNMTVYVTVQVWHRDNEDKQDNQCFSHEGQSPSQWDLRDYGVVEPSCVCPRGVPQVDCPDDLCSDRRCLAYPDAVCVVSNCGRCSVDFYDAVYDSYDDVNSLDCSLRDRCTGECQDKFDACMRYGPCREALYELVKQRQRNGACDEACYDGITVPTRRAQILLQAIWSCYWKCDAGSYTYQPVCAQPALPGPCKASIGRWYFDKPTQQCQQFTYGGCGGNSNNFESREACEQRCAVGACCTRRMEPTNGGGYGYGYDRSGYDRYGYNRTGYARDGFSLRALTYAPFTRNSYDAYGLDERGYDTRGRDGYGFNIRGYSETYSRDGQQFGYLADEQYDATGRDRAGLDRSGYDRDGYGYDGTYQGAEFSCQQMTRSACQALETGDGQVEVVSFAQGKTCKERRCGNPKWEAPRQCVYGGQRYDFGETFTFGCQTCFCATDGSVSCECSAVTTRREIRDMTVEEVQAFTDAVVLLEQSNMWSAFANTHLGAVPQAHGNPAFWPWHREFLKQLELTLREVSGNCNVTIPYWDWTIDALSPETSPVWNVVGGNGNGVDQCVTDGPFAGFSPCIERNWALGWAMPSFAEIAGILAGTDYSTVVAEIEARHGDVHVFVGGTMATYSSPYDPLFFLHHAFVDKLWYDWQVTLGNGNQYPASMLHMTLDPFAKTAAEVLDSEAQLCVVYAAPGQSPPCNETAYGGTPGTEGYYVNTTRPQYNRDGYDSNGRDVYGRDRYGRGADGEYVDVPVDANNMYGSDRYGFDVRGYDAYGFDENGLDERGCGTGSGAPLYMRDVYRVQRGVYERIQNRTYQPPTRTCRPLQPLPTWWRNINWMRRGDEYQAVIDAYELKVQATYDAKSGQTYRNEYARRPQSYALQDLCFDAGEYVPRPSDDVPGDSYQCPPGVVAYACLRDPCEDATCPGDPTATCRANTCGGCRAEFYVGDGTRAQCHRPCASAYTCDYNPCAQATCEAHPDAVCEFNPCYGCNAVWVNATTGESVECEVEPDPCVSYGESFVCGVDGQTYDNVCYARSAGVEVAYGGVCVSCEERCPEYGAMEACGEDGTTYPSVCHARCANVKVVYPGECQPPPETCEDVNSFKGSDEFRQSLCNQQTSCLSRAYRDTDNRCFWNTETRKCSCESSQLVCTAGRESCLACCNNDLRLCLRAGAGPVTRCWDNYLACKLDCSSTFTVEVDVSIVVEVRFSIMVTASLSRRLDANQLAEAVSLAAGVVNLLPANVSVRSVTSASVEVGRGRRAEGDISLDVGVMTTDANMTSQAIEDSFTQGTLAEQMASQTGSASDEDLALLGGLAVVNPQATEPPSSSTLPPGGNNGGPTNEPPVSTTDDGRQGGSDDSTGLGGGAIAGILAAIGVTVLLVAIALHQRAEKKKREQSYAVVSTA